MKIDNVGGIRSLDLTFNPRMNVICGMNGVGKTTILDCIAHSFSLMPSGKLKRNSRSEKGKWSVEIDGSQVTNELKSLRPSDSENQQQNLVHSSKNVMYVKEHRNIEYQPLASIERDEDRDAFSYAQYLVHGIRHQRIKSWFLNRLVFCSLGRFSEEELVNLEIAKKSFTLLDKNVKFSHVVHDTFDIMLETTRGEVYFEYLSSGFKSCLFIILGIIREIETNFKEPKVNVADFDGIILIDEADAHLHPHWQGKFLRVLKNIFNNAQIIVTTHSPHMIQAAEANEIIALGLDANEEVYRVDLGTHEYGFQGWTVEEILEDVMGLKETKSNLYLEHKSRFEEAIENEDANSAKESYDILMKMLHPRSHMRKIYELQLGTLGEEYD